MQIFYKNYLSRTCTLFGKKCTAFEVEDELRAWIKFENILGQNDWDFRCPSQVYTKLLD